MGQIYKWSYAKSGYVLYTYVVHEEAYTHEYVHLRVRISAQNMNQRTVLFPIVTPTTLSDTSVETFAPTFSIPIYDTKIL